MKYRSTLAASSTNYIILEMLKFSKKKIKSKKINVFVWRKILEFSENIWFFEMNYSQFINYWQTCTEAAPVLQ